MVGTSNLGSWNGMPNDLYMVGTKIRASLVPSKASARGSVRSMASKRDPWGQNSREQAVCKPYIYVHIYIYVQYIYIYVQYIYVQYIYVQYI